MSLYRHHHFTIDRSSTWNRRVLKENSGLRFQDDKTLDNRRFVQENCPLKVKVNVCSDKRDWIVNQVPFNDFESV